MLNQETGNHRNFDQEKLEVLALTGIYTAVTTFFGLLFKDSVFTQPLGLMAAIGFGFFVFWWCRIDSDERNQPMSYAFSIFLVIFGAIGLIYYLLKSRNLKQGLLSIGWVIVLFFGMIVINVLVLMVHSAIFQTKI